MLNYAPGYLIHVIIYMTLSGTILYHVHELPQSYYVDN